MQDQLSLEISAYRLYVPFHLHVLIALGGHQWWSSRQSRLPSCNTISQDVSDKPLLNVLIYKTWATVFNKAHISLTGSEKHFFLRWNDAICIMLEDIWDPVGCVSPAIPRPSDPAIDIHTDNWKRNNSCCGHQRGGYEIDQWIPF